MVEFEKPSYQVDEKEKTAVIDVIRSKDFDRKVTVL